MNFEEIKNIFEFTTGENRKHRKAFEAAKTFYVFLAVLL